MLELAQYQITGSTAREIAASVEAGIRREELSAGSALPTVRALADTLEVSPATVSAAYRLLRERGLVRGEGRRGTRVAPRPAVRRPGGGAGGDAVDGLRDLSVGMPDPALLPSLQAGLGQVDVAGISGAETEEFVIPELVAVAEEWFRADDVDPRFLTVVSGALDALERIVAATLRAGDRVLIEDPAYPPFRDILLAAGLVEIPVEVDAHGMRPEALAAALERGAQAMLVVPRAQNPTGAAIDAARRDELRALLQSHPELLVIEDDHASAVSGAPYAGPAGRRERWAVIRSVSKILHPDLRLAMIAGDEQTIARVEGRQALGPRWVSRLLQSIAAAMLADPGFPALCARAARAYAQRRALLVTALADQGIAVPDGFGLNMWVPVREEAPATRALADAGFFVGPSERYRLRTGPGVRITTATLEPGEAEAVAAAIARGERTGRARRAY